MQDNVPLMRALAKLVSTNNPDKILFVGEALVGNEAVDQLQKFDRALRDFSSAAGTGKERGIDGMIVTKWDTVDDKVRVAAQASNRALTVICGGVGRRGAVDDLCDGSADRVCRMWTGEFFSSFYLFYLIFIYKLYHINLYKHNHHLYILYIHIN